MRILIISPTQKGIGGVARHVQGLTKFLKEEGHEVEIISSENTFTIPIRKLKNPSFMISSYLKTKFKKNYDIVHAQNPIAALAMKNILGKKVLSIHGIHDEQIKLLHGELAGNIATNFDDKALSWADIITVSSKEMSKYYSEKGFNIHYLTNAIDVKSLQGKSDKRFDKQIIYAARLSKEKGILEVIEMAKKLPDDIHLLILGSGVEESKVKQLIKNKKNVHYLGYQNKENTLSLIRGSDLLIQPSLHEGGLSYTLLESMACKTPIICTNAGGGRDVLEHLKNAYIVESKNHMKLFDAVIELMSDIQKREQLAITAYESVKEFDWSIIGPKYLEIYEKLLNSSK